MDKHSQAINEIHEFDLEGKKVFINYLHINLKKNEEKEGNLKLQ